MTLDRQQENSGLWNSFLLNQDAKKAQSFFQAFFDSNVFAMGVFNKNFQITQVNQAFSISLGYSENGFVNLKSLIENHEMIQSKRTKQQLKNGTVMQQEWHIKHLQGHSVVMYFAIIPVFDEEEFDGAILLGRDITERRRDESIHRQLAFYDDMTGLPNRRSFFSTLGRFLREKASSLTSLDIVILSLDNLKELNDFGFHIGDSALKLVGNILVKSFDHQTFLSRINGNEFALIIENGRPEQILEKVQKLIFTLNYVPHRLYGKETLLECSVGMSQWPVHGNTVEKLIHSAEKAMFAAKNTRQGYCFFTADMNPAHQQKLEWKMKQALQEDQFYLVYQPIVHLETQKVLGYEALIRWQHPKEGVIPPNEFIPLAEQSGFIIDIENKVLQLACQELKKLLEIEPGLYLSVNISALHFQQNIVEHIQEAVDKEGVDPRQLKIEITETFSMKEPAMTIDKLIQLRDLGVKVSIDDFGVGYSSLQYLGTFPIDEVKLDQTFINPITPQKSTIIKAVMTIAHDYQISVIAEGIETADQLEYLKSLGCEFGQGYLLGRPTKR